LAHSFFFEKRSQKEIRITKENCDQTAFDLHSLLIQQALGDGDGEVMRGIFPVCKEAGV
jgi:hypothetical protein